MDDLERVREIYSLDKTNRETRFLIFAPVVNARLQYTCRFVFNHVLKVQAELTTNPEKFLASGDFRINYSFRDIPGVFRVKPNPLISESSMLHRHPEPFFKDGQIYFFPNSENMAGLHFDIFAAVFYFISRHEEWQDFAHDRHQRFEASESLLFKKQFHLRPVVDQWILEFNLALRRLYPALKFPVKHFRAVSTIDVDNLYAYRGKGLVRNLGGAAKDLLKLQFSSLLQRGMVAAGLRKDPFDVYDQLSRFARQHDLPQIYFFLMRHGTRYDRTIDPRRGCFAPVIKKLKDHHLVGLHPSYGAAYNSTLLEDELEQLVKAKGNPALISRQHYLRFDIRRTPGILLAHGIAADFTMGFATTPGFRAGTSHPFYYYDFKHEKESSLLFVPFCFMDGAFSVYDKKNTREGLVQLLAMAAEVKNTGGFFTTVYHERSFSDRLYKGFGTLYKNLHGKLAELEKQ